MLYYHANLIAHELHLAESIQHLTQSSISISPFALNLSSKLNRGGFFTPRKGAPDYYKMYFISNLNA
jgi:hypothetical protein